MESRAESRRDSKFEALPVTVNFHSAAALAVREQKDPSVTAEISLTSTTE